MAVLAAAVIVFVLLTQDGAADAATWAVLTGGAVLGGAVLVGAAFVARAEARGVSRQHASLRRAVAAGQSDLQDLLQRLERGEPVGQVPFTDQASPRTDPVGRLAYEISVAMWQARTVVAQTAQSSRTASPDSEEKVEVFVNLARRLQSLVHRAISMLDQLENEVEDPELLKGLFHVDHLATRIRRHAENVAVLGGSVSRRQWTRPVTLTEVLRSSIAEVEQYSRVKLVPPIEGTLRGHAVADVIHLLAELVENATSFSEPHTQVLLRAQRVTSGLAVEVEDRGLGMPPQEQARINALLAEPDHIDLSKLLADGRIGLYVVSALARRHGIAVRLQSNIYGGIQAVLIIPRGLLGDEPAEAPAQAATDMPQPAQVAPAPRPAQVAPAQQPAVQASPARPVTPPPSLRQPLPPVTTASAPMPPQQHARGAGATAPRDGESAYGRVPRDERPPLPQRHAQEHLVPELRNGPVSRRSEDEEVEHDPGLMATFRRGVSLADNESDEPPTDGSR
ncbi:ATP-binding protein [Streptomyces sp. NL15-2K]|uniref:ATP-binding protein n=1 Tax=Streptomyces sp. NL15-2K TaxID=376149 RepID=UPI00155A1E12|nr:MULTISPECIES: ATP-binding protein [Actinomycetes]WKX08851.1 ATP-binding protein [Kutzneria buriramensis]